MTETYKRHFVNNIIIHKTDNLTNPLVRHIVKQRNDFLPLFTWDYILLKVKTLINSINHSMDNYPTDDKNLIYIKLPYG